MLWSSILSNVQKKLLKKGYAFVYVSNQADDEWVYFDNFAVTHERGRILEESTYYPDGLKIAGLCAKAYNKLPNEFGYQGNYSEEEEESGYDEFALRHYDPTIGRWLSTDPYDEFASPYLGMGNDPVNNVDPDGGSVWDPIGKILRGIFSGGGGSGPIGQWDVLKGSSSGGGGFNFTTATINLGASLLGNAVGRLLFPLPKANARQLPRPQILNSGSSFNTMKTTTDAGHGDKNAKNKSVFDSGAVGEDDKTQYEKDYTLMIEEATNAWLTAFGIDNTRTRTGDKDARPGGYLVWRNEVANNAQSEVFISFHLDQAGDTKNLKIIYQQDRADV